jgi:cyclophilin family peptidyl-prolyl cis-trans isomerase
MCATTLKLRIRSVGTLSCGSASIGCAAFDIVLTQAPHESPLTSLLKRMAEAERAFLELDFDNQHAKHERAKQFVTDQGAAILGLSSNKLGALTNEERDNLADVYEEEGHCRDPIRVAPPDCGRIELELFHQTSPNAAKNFALLCSGSAGRGKRGIHRSYKGCKIFRSKNALLAQSGDFVKNNGSAGEPAICNKPFKDDAGGLKLSHERGVLSMANSGKNTNTSQFFIAFQRLPKLDGSHCVFGKVADDSSSAEALANLEKHSAPSDSESETPPVDITIVDCGTL